MQKTAGMAKANQKRQREADHSPPPVVISHFASIRCKCSQGSPQGCPAVNCLSTLLPITSAQEASQAPTSQCMIKSKPIMAVACGPPIVSSYASQMHLYPTADISQSHGCALVGAIITDEQSTEDRRTHKIEMTQSNDVASDASARTFEIETRTRLPTEELMQLLRLANSTNKALVLMGATGTTSKALVLEYTDNL